MTGHYHNPNPKPSCTVLVSQWKSFCWHQWSLDQTSLDACEHNKFNSAGSYGYFPNFYCGPQPLFLLSETDCVRTVQHIPGFHFSFLRKNLSWNGERVQIQSVGKGSKISRNKKRMTERETSEKKTWSCLTWFSFTVGLPQATPYGSECRITPSPLRLNSAEAELLVYFHAPIELLSASISWNEKGKKKQPYKLWACSFANKPTLPRRPCWLCSNAPCSFV